MNANRKILVVIIIITITNIIKAQNIMNLTQRQQFFIEIAAFEALGDMPKLQASLYHGLKNKIVTVTEIKETFTHLYAYTGFPRALNGLEALRIVILENKLEDEPNDMKDEYINPKNLDNLEKGIEIQTKLCGGKPYNYSFYPRIDYFLKAHLFGDIFDSPILNETDREIITISAIATLKGCESQLAAHINGGLNMGLTQDNIIAISEILRQKVGNEYGSKICKILHVPDDITVNNTDSVDFNIWPKGELNTEYSKYFIGNSYLASMDSENGGPINVTFEPRCRNNWHIHHHCVQVLICVSGRGWYQEDGKEAVEMKVGSVIVIPEGVKHWHGAAKDSWFQHLTYTTKVGENASNEWLEQVSDSEYNKLK